jgi:hypothetical protein
MENSPRCRQNITNDSLAFALSACLSRDRLQPLDNRKMNTLARYLELIVDPAFDDFHANRGSVRHAFLACVVIYHSVDRVAETEGKSTAHLRQGWGKESVEFKLVDVIAHHFKHVKSTDERIPSSRPGLPIGLALGFNEAGDEMNLRSIYFVVRDAVRFVHRKAGTIHPALPE